MGLAIAGFHRSGTSSVAQHLAKSGLNLGSDLIGATSDNPHGHFEDWAPVRFHDSVLQASGLDWASTTDIEIPINDENNAFISDYCSQRMASGEPWGFKDPRICQFLDRWMAIAPALKAVVVYRSPAECAWSLYRRTVRLYANENISEDIYRRFIDVPDHALALWVTHNEKLLNVVRQFPDRTVVVGQTAFAAGFNLGAELKNRYEMGLTPAPISETYDEAAISQNVPPLPVFSPELAARAMKIWNDLTSLDIGSNSGRSDLDFFCVDTTGLLLRNRIFELQLKELVSAKSKLINRLESAKVIARKLRSPPFSIFFKGRKKYRRLLEDLDD